MLIALINIPFAIRGIKDMHRYNFLGADIAGETLKELTKPGERVFLYSHYQAFGVARYAQRYMQWPETLEEFKKNEKKFNIKYACFFPSSFIRGLEHNNPEFFRYIQRNYRLKEIGLVKEKNIFLIDYFILEKSSNLNSADFLKINYQEPKLKKTYRTIQELKPYYSVRF